MRVLLLGVGMQGTAALHDLIRSPGVAEIIAADADPRAAHDLVRTAGASERVRVETLDASDPGDLDRLFASSLDVAIDLLPARFVDAVATAAVRHRVHVVNTMYVTPGLGALAQPASAAGVTLLPELGMDPGIDLVMLGDAARSLDRISVLDSYGSGIPAPEAADNPLRYKVSWALEGVLASYARDARVIRDGTPREIDRHALFRAHNTHRVELDSFRELGALEAYPNGDVLPYLEALEVDPATVTRAGRYTLRWPGHCAFWDSVTRLGLLDDEPVSVDGAPVNRRRFLAAALEPRLQYGPTERDLAILLLRVEGSRSGRPCRIDYELLEARDPETGLTAMARLVGFTASIGAQMIGRGEISRRGLLSPLHHVPYASLEAALARRSILIRRTESAGT